MSQKPKPAVPARAASVAPVAPKEVEVKAPVAAALPLVKPEPVIQQEPVVMPEPVIKYEPIAEAAPVADAVQKASVSATESLGKTIEAASDVTAASVDAVSRKIETTADNVTAVAAEVVETASRIKPIKPNLTQGMKTMMKSTEDFVAFGQANLEAFVKSGQIWSAGVQELTKQIATTAKASFDESISTFKAMSTAKSVKEAMDLQSSFAKAALEKAMAESNKLTDASIKLTEQTLAPITARVTVAVETFGKSA
jgi:phasin family protein